MTDTVEASLVEREFKFQLKSLIEEKTEDGMSLEDAIIEVIELVRSRED